MVTCVTAVAVKVVWYSGGGGCGGMVVLVCERCYELSRSGDGVCGESVVVRAIMVRDG